MLYNNYSLHCGLDIFWGGGEFLFGLLPMCIPQLLGTPKIQVECDKMCLHLRRFPLTNVEELQETHFICWLLSYEICLASRKKM